MSISLNEMSQLAKALIDADKTIDDIEQSLKDAKERARQLREEAIPSAMHELGLEQIVLDTGEKVTIKQEVYASIPKDRKVEAFDWLDDNGFGGLIKVEVTADFGKGEALIAESLAKELQQRGLKISLDQGVHASTLKAFLKEQISAGTNIPLDLFGAMPVWQAKITNK